MKLDEIQLDPIGIVTSSAFVQKWGTPRQGALTPEAAADISLTRHIGSTVSVDDRVAIVWSAHLNGDSFNFLKARIKPPKKILGKRTVGVFATRGVHRPSSIGLTFCRVSKIDGLVLSVTGADMILGTPVLSIQKIHNHLSIDPNTVRCPDWTKVEKIAIRWSLGSFMHLSSLGLHAQKQITSLVESTLSQDPRSVHSVYKHVDPIYEVELRVGELTTDTIWVIYRHHFDWVEVVTTTTTRVVSSYRSRTEQWLHRLVEKLPFIQDFHR